MNKRSMRQADVAPADRSADEVNNLVRCVAEATPMELVELEWQGVTVAFLRTFAAQLGVSDARLSEIIGVPKGTNARRSAEVRVVGAAGHAAIALIELLAEVQEIVANSTSPRAEGFDVAKWLGQWIELPQPALDGRRPVELIGTPTGARVVLRLLGGIESGAQAPEKDGATAIRDLTQPTSALKEDRPVVHSDRGGHCRSPRWLSRIAGAQLVRSMSRKGYSPDNAACEGFFGRLKTELFYSRNWLSTTIDEFVAALAPTSTGTTRRG